MATETDDRKFSRDEERGRDTPDYVLRFDLIPGVRRHHSKVYQMRWAPRNGDS